MSDRKTAMRAESVSASINQAQSVLEFSWAKPESCQLSRFPRNNGISLLHLLLIAPLFLCFSSLQVQAQAGIDMGSITGTVKDPSGALVSHAQCTLTNTSTGVSQSTVSTSAGAYTFSIVLVGTYSLSVSAAGFKESVLNNIVVHLGSSDTEDIKLELGAVTEHVNVTSEAPLLQAQDTSLGMTVQSSMVNNLPISGGGQGRSVLSLLILAPGAQPVNSQLINGVQSGALDVRVNGADNNAEVFGGQIIPPIPDAVEEFKLQSGDNPADVGHSYGTTVNLVTKVGTNSMASCGSTTRTI